MTFEIDEDLSGADIAFRVSGKDLVELFIAGAHALISIMLKDQQTISKKKEVVFTCEADDPELLYYDFLTEIIYYKDSEKLLLLPERLDITHSGDGYRLSCTATGETIDRSRHMFTVDIKAITMHKLTITRDDSGYTATTVVDV